MAAAAFCYEMQLLKWQEASTLIWEVRLIFRNGLYPRNAFTFYFQRLYDGSSFTVFSFFAFLGFLVLSISLLHFQEEWKGRPSKQLNGPVPVPDSCVMAAHSRSRRTKSGWLVISLQTFLTVLAASQTNHKSLGLPTFLLHSEIQY